MTRKVFYSFHYLPDGWRASQVRNCGVVEGNVPVSDNDWETITATGDAAIKTWIKDQLAGRSCALVLIGNQTAGRKWITYEIEKAWNDGKGVVGVYVHNLKDASENQTSKGANPFDSLTLKNGTVKLSSVAKAYDPPFTISTYVYNHIKENISAWVEEAITIRNSQ
jgi:Thoeris protein ThsB, TIR-like domain